VKILSDCNSVFINHILTGAKVQASVCEVRPRGGWRLSRRGERTPGFAWAGWGPCQQGRACSWTGIITSIKHRHHHRRPCPQVLTNSASFERVADDAADGAPSLGASDPIIGTSLQRAASHRLVVTPRQAQGHCCKLCPANLCKGAEVGRPAACSWPGCLAAVSAMPALCAAVMAMPGLGLGHGLGAARGSTRTARAHSVAPPPYPPTAQLRKIQAQQGYRRVVFAGDGANDVCPALALGAGDVVLAREGYALAKYLAAAQQEGSALQRPAAQVRLWSSHEQLLGLVQELLK
jgi:hypothetical protein